MSEENEKITLVCTSLGKNPELLQRMLDSAIGFDSIIVHTNKVGFYFPGDDRQPSYTRDMTIPEAYNMIIGELVNTQWVCCFCDDDYFYPEVLSKMIDEVHEGIVAGIAHYKFHVSGYTPPQDLRCLFGKKEYDLWEPRKITPRLLSKHNRLPAGSFFRKIVWEKIGGFQGEKEHDRNFWLRAAQEGFEFKYFPYLVYNFERRENSAWCTQQST